MSRKTHHPAKSLPACRAPRSAVHRRRHRGIRHFRKATPPATVSHRPRRPGDSGQKRRWNLDRSALASWTSVVLLGTAVSLTVAGIQWNLSNLFDSPFAPQVRAIQWLPLAVILPAALGCFGSAWLAVRVGARMPDDCSTTIGYTGLATGLCAALLPLLMPIASQGSAWVHAHFALSNWPLRFLQLGLMLLVCTLPLAGLGCTGQLMHSLNFRNLERRRPLVRLALALGVLSGLGVGILVAWLLSARPASLLPAASLPMLLLAVIAGKLPESSSPVSASKEA